MKYRSCLNNCIQKLNSTVVDNVSVCVPDYGWGGQAVRTGLYRLHQRPGSDSGDFTSQATDAAVQRHAHRHAAGAEDCCYEQTFLLGEQVRVSGGKKEQSDVLFCHRCILSAIDECYIWDRSSSHEDDWTRDWAFCWMFLIFKSFPGFRLELQQLIDYYSIDKKWNTAILISNSLLKRDILMINDVNFFTPNKKQSRFASVILTHGLKTWQQMQILSCSVFFPFFSLCVYVKKFLYDCISLKFVL